MSVGQLQQISRLRRRAKLHKVGAKAASVDAAAACVDVAGISLTEGGLDQDEGYPIRVVQCDYFLFNVVKEDFIFKKY